MAVLRLHLIRHPQPAVARGLCYGRLDVAPHAAAAPAQVDALLRRLPAVQGVHTSPALRCQALARAIAARDGVGLGSEPDLAELDFGAWEGQTWDALPRDQIDAWAIDPWCVAPPGGETYAALSRRVQRVLARLAVAPARTLALVTHAGPMRSILAPLRGLAPQRYPVLPIGWCEVFTLEHDGARWAEVPATEAERAP